MEDTPISVRTQLYINSAEHQLQLAQRGHIWCSCISTAIASLNRSRFRQHSRVDHSGIPTAISCKKRIYRRCMSPARYSFTSTGIKAKPFWKTRPCRAQRYTNRDQQKKNISGADICHQRGVAVYQQQSKPQANALLENAAVSTRAVYQPISAKHKHVWRSCISPARYINRDQQSKGISGADSCHQRGIPATNSIKMKSESTSG